MNTERSQVGWGFWLWWVLASIVGLAVAFAADSENVGLAVGVVIGAITGVVLLWLLRQPVTEEPSLPQEAA